MKMEDYSLSLDDGEYKVTSINQDNSNGGTIPMNVSFNVQDGNLIVNDEPQEELNLNLPKPNFIGQLKNSAQI